MKLRRLMRNCPWRTKLTKGQHCASQQNWLANDAVGSIAPDPYSRRLRQMSALPPIASEFPPPNELTQSEGAMSCAVAAVMGIAPMRTLQGVYS